jgi:hypothetical protein
MALEDNDYESNFPQSISDCHCDNEWESRMEEEEQLEESWIESRLRFGI